MRTLGPFELSDWAQTNMPEESLKLSLKVMKSMLRATSFFSKETSCRLGFAALIVRPDLLHVYRLYALDSPSHKKWNYFGAHPPPPRGGMNLFLDLAHTLVFRTLAAFLA